MAVRKIRIWPDPVLKGIAEPVTNVDADVAAIVDDMFDTMYAFDGVGLAAPQIGVPKRIVVIDVNPRGNKKDDEIRRELEALGFTGPTAFINPEILSGEGELIWQEGCLSVPGVSEPIKRKEKVRVKAIGVDGNEFTLDASGLFAVAVQHETDHLNGRVFVDYLSRLKREVIRRKMERLRKEGEEETAGEEASITS